MGSSLVPVAVKANIGLLILRFTRELLRTPHRQRDEAMAIGLNWRAALRMRVLKVIGEGETVIDRLHLMFQVGLDHGRLYADQLVHEAIRGHHGDNAIHLVHFGSVHGDVAIPTLGPVRYG